MDNRNRPKHPRLTLFTLSLVALLNSASAAIPYTPSSIFLSPQHNDSFAYLLRPSSATVGKTEFLSLNLSISFSSRTPSYNVLLDQTPFQSNGNTSAFIPTIDDQGIITVYAGDCHNSSTNPELWRFRPDNTSSTGNGTWHRQSMNTVKGQTRPNYLASGFTFAPSHTSETSVYAFGGMCPFQNSTDQEWISTASYSQSMVVLGPDALHSAEYDASIIAQQASPVREAGTAIVPLPASYSHSTTEMQQDFLLIGGHTQNAFLNMSELALFSLPQESWSYVKVDSEPTQKTELAVREGSLVEPRSGHTAVLSEDRTAVYVLGGWVGDTSTPAKPQFAVLEIAHEYGGSGDWAWKIPSSEGPGLAEGTGIFGHAAAMLPGGVMVIAGGYNIPKKSWRRSISATHNSQVYLYNVTSNRWVTSYTNPAARHSAKISTSSKGALSTPGQKAGLGVGLGLGIPAIIALAFFGWWYHSRRRGKRQRDSQLRDLALGAERAHFWGRDEPHQVSSIRSSQMSEKQDPATVYPWTGNRGFGGRPAWRDQGDGRDERTGLLMDAPSPPKNNRPFSSPRSYRLSGPSDFRRSDTMSEIHPIDEREEDEAVFRERLMATIPTKEKPETVGPVDTLAEDPFATPRSTIFGVGLNPIYSRRKDIGSTGLDGRISPTKSEHSSTHQSESPAPSFSSRISNHFSQARAVLVDQPLSWASSGRKSLERVAVASTHSKETAHSDPEGVTAPSDKSLSGDSYSTAQTNLSNRHAESESLLFDTPDTTITAPESSPSKLPPGSKPRTSDWMMQTMRRALTLTRRGSTAQKETSTAQVASGIDRRSTVIGSSPPASVAGSDTPRRAVSASAELFHRKQGAKDWAPSTTPSDDVFTTPRSTRDDLFLGAPGYLGEDANLDEEDWDVEGAAQGRRVQVSFTVPREKLRVVNATAGDLDNLSERSVSRSIGERKGTGGMSG